MKNFQQKKKVVAVAFGLLLLTFVVVELIRCDLIFLRNTKPKTTSSRSREKLSSQKSHLLHTICHEEIHLTFLRDLWFSSNEPELNHERRNSSSRQKQKSPPAVMILWTWTDSWLANQQAEKPLDDDGMMMTNNDDTNYQVKVSGGQHRNFITSKSSRWSNNNYFTDTFLIFMNIFSLFWGNFTSKFPSLFPKFLSLWLLTFSIFIIHFLETRTEPSRPFLASCDSSNGWNGITLPS